MTYPFKIERTYETENPDGHVTGSVDLVICGTVSLKPETCMEPASKDYEITSIVSAYDNTDESSWAYDWANDEAHDHIFGGVAA